MKLTPVDLNQLLKIARYFCPGLTAKELLTGDADFFHDHVDSIAEVPVEWWDITEAGKPKYQLWLYNADGGILLRAGTTRRVAGVIQSGFDINEELRPVERFAIADAVMIAYEPKSELASVRFDDEDDA